MTNKFYAAGEQRAARVKGLFAAIAPRYDLINDLQSFGLHRYWKRRLLQLAHGRPGERALDVCCGTGNVAFALARQGLDVIGLDFSEPMLAVAESRSKVQSPKSKVQSPKSEVSPTSLPPASSPLHPPSSILHPPFPPPRFLQGDAQNLPFPDASFDLVTISYGLRNLADWEAGLREMRRVAAPGGRLLVLDFGKPDNALWRAIYFAYLRRFVPLLGRVFSGDSDTHAYILESLNHYAAQKGVDAKLRELQLVHPRIINLMGGVMSLNYAEKAR